MTDRQLIEDLLRALEYHTEQTRPIEFSKVAIEAAREYLRKPPQRKLTDGQIDAAVKAWFEDDVVGRQTFANRMRAAIEAAHGIKENT